MSTRLHLTPEGPKSCSADPMRSGGRRCKYEEAGHYDSLTNAEQAFAEQMGGSLPPALKSGYSKELLAAIEHFTIANDLSCSEASELALRLRSSAESSGEEEMYRGMTGYGGVSGVPWDRLKPGVSLAMNPRSWTSDEAVADLFSWDESADEDDTSIKSVLLVATSGIEGVQLREYSSFDWQKEMVSTAGIFIVDRVELRDDSESLENAESLLIVGHWETVELDDTSWKQALVPFTRES